MADHTWDLDGLALGDNTPYVFMNASGFDSPSQRTEDLMRPLAHGQFSIGQDYLTGRVIQMQFGINDDYGSSTLQDRIDALKAKMIPTDDELVLSYEYNGAAARRVYVRPRRIGYDLDDLMRFGIPTVTLEFLAPDPRIYDDEIDVETVSPGETTGGMDFTHGFPFGFGSATPGGLDAVNEGNFPTPFTATVTASGGGISSFSLTNSTTGEVFSMTIDLADSEVMHLDFDARTALLGGTASRIGYVDRPESTWFDLEPGSNPIDFSSTGAGTATLEVSWRSAWL